MLQPNVTGTLPLKGLPLCRRGDCQFGHVPQCRSTECAGGSLPRQPTPPARNRHGTPAVHSAQVYVTRILQTHTGGRTGLEGPSGGTIFTVSAFKNDVIQMPWIPYRPLRRQVKCRGDRQREGAFPETCVQAAFGNPTSGLLRGRPGRLFSALWPGHPNHGSGLAGTGAADIRR